MAERPLGESAGAARGQIHPRGARAPALPALPALPAKATTPAYWKSFLLFITET